jgi:RNA polymerase sigma factor (sigma-70 family)
MAADDPLEPGRAETVFEAFYRRHQNTWYQYALLHTGDRDAALDVTNEVTRQLITSWELALSQECVERYTWALFRRELAVWQAQHDGRSRFVQAASFELVFHAMTWTGEYFALKDSEWLCRAIYDLPPRQHEVAVLHFMMKLSEERVAETLGIAAPSARSNIRHARAGLEPQADARRLLHSTETEG